MIGRFDFTPQGKREQVGGKGAGEAILFGEEPVFELLNGAERSLIEEQAAGIDRLSAFIGVPPQPDRVWWSA